MASVSRFILGFFQLLLAPFIDNPDTYREFELPELSNDNYMRVENALAALRGVQHPSLDTTNGTVVVGFYSSHVSEEQIAAALRAEGFTVKSIRAE